MTDLSPFSCRTLGAFLSPKNSVHPLFAAIPISSPAATRCCFLSITSKAQLHLLPLKSSRLVLHTPCFLPAFPHLVPQSLLFLIDFCTSSCFTRRNNSCSGQRVSPWPGPQGCKSNLFPASCTAGFQQSRAHKPHRCHPPWEHFPHTLISYHYETSPWNILLKEKGLN